MAIQKINIEKFLELAATDIVLDVRSPGEYMQAHIPGAYNLPLFSNEERKLIGTTYKQQNRETAIKIGLDLFGGKMRAMVEMVEGMIGDCRSANRELKTERPSQMPDQQRPILLLHCWRGGMRSASVAWLLDLYGFKVYTLAGGYKAYRQWVLAQFEKDHAFKIIGGYTGSGKTLLIQELERQGKRVIDLEALAGHKGSAFGAVGQQPRQEMFENLLVQQLSAVAEREHIDTNNQHLPTDIYIEDESQRIGDLQIPMQLWNRMRKCPILFIDISFEKRLKFITDGYSKAPKEMLVTAVMRIQKRLGGLETKNAISHLLEDNYEEAFRILLRYYDKWYDKGLMNREGLAILLTRVPCSGIDTVSNVQKLLRACPTVNI